MQSTKIREEGIEGWQEEEAKKRLVSILGFVYNNLEEIEHLKIKDKAICGPIKKLKEKVDSLMDKALERG
jgi:ABC-type histidine transport system ATPase subunit